MMELSAIVIYLVGFADKILETLNFFIFFAMLSLLWGFFKAYPFPGEKITEEERSKGKKIAKYALIVIVASELMQMFIPSSKTIIAMVAIPPVINNEVVQKLPKNLIEFLNDYLESYRPNNQKGDPK